MAPNRKNSNQRALNKHVHGREVKNGQNSNQSLSGEAERQTGAKRVESGRKRGVLVFHEKVVEPTSPKRDAFKAVPIETNSITQKAIQMESPTLL